MEGSVTGPQPGTPTDVKCQMISKNVGSSKTIKGKQKA